MSSYFFKVISSREFFDLFHIFPPVSQTEEIPLEKSDLRVLAEAIQAPEDLPHYSRSAMDGYAVKARDSFGCSEFNPVYLNCVLEIEINSFPDIVLIPGQCARLYTGSPLPSGADSVIMEEYTQEISSSEIEIRKSVYPGENVILKGEDCQMNQICLSPETVMRSQEIGLLAALGLSKCRVYKKIKTAIISTGDELIPIHLKPYKAQIRDVNTYSLSSFIRMHSYPCKKIGIVKDNLQELKQALQTAVDECDLVLVSGGSSVGTKDLTLQALQNLPKSSILAHGIAISPGKPTILAKSGNTPIVGLPGQVASALIVLKILILPLIRHLNRETCSFKLEPRQKAVLTRNIPSKQGREDYVRVCLIEKKKELPKAEPIFAKSGLLKSLLQSHGLVCVPEFSEGFEAGEIVQVIPF